MRLVLLLAPLFVLTSAASAQGEPASAKITLKSADAAVTDDQGTVLFRGSRDFILKVAKNSSGEIYGFDGLRRRLRITPTSESGLWLSCSELDRSGLCALASPKRRSGNRGSRQMPDLQARGVPACPGDPRCPKLED